MQQTEKYKLNLIERDDPFLPEALNDSTQKIEAALDAHEEKVDSRVDDLDQRVTVLEGHRVAVGIYRGTGESMEVSLGFNPKVMMVFMYDSPGYTGILLDGGHEPSGLLRKDDGFFAYGRNNFTLQNCRYGYFAIG